MISNNTGLSGEHERGIQICVKFIFVRLSLTRNSEIARLKLNSVRVVVSIVKNTSLNTPGLILVGIVFNPKLV